MSKDENKIQILNIIFFPLREIKNYYEKINKKYFEKNNNASKFVIFK